MNLVVCRIVIALLFAVSMNGQEGRAIRVWIDITTDATTKALLTSYFTRNLRQLGDVILVDSAPDRKIRMIAVVTNITNVTPLYSLSLAVSTPIDPQTVANIVKQSNTTGGMRAWIIKTFGSSEVPGPYLLNTGPDLEKICKEAIGIIDTNSFAPFRKEMHDVRERLERMSQESKGRSKH